MELYEQLKDIYNVETKKVVELINDAKKFGYTAKEIVEYMYSLINLDDPLDISMKSGKLKNIIIDLGDTGLIKSIIDLVEKYPDIPVGDIAIESKDIDILEQTIGAMRNNTKNRPLLIRLYAAKVKLVLLSGDETKIKDCIEDIINNCGDFPRKTIWMEELNSALEILKKKEIGNVKVDEKTIQKVYRYMSADEFIKMSSGVDMVPYHTDFDKRATNSRGFCFLGEKTVGYIQEYKISRGEFIAYIEKRFANDNDKISDFRELAERIFSVSMTHLVSAARNLFGGEELDEYIKSIEHNEKVGEYTAIECMRFLSGIVSSDVLVEFEVNDDIELSEGYGIYAKGGGAQRINEFSCMGYNIQNLAPTRWAIARDIHGYEVEDEIRWELYDPHKFNDIKGFY